MESLSKEFCQCATVVCQHRQHSEGGGRGACIWRTHAAAIGEQVLFLGQQRVAMRKNGTLTYLHGDQARDYSRWQRQPRHRCQRTTLSQQRYLPYGGLRWAQSGSVFPTDWQWARLLACRPAAPKHPPDRHRHGRVLRLCAKWRAPG